MELAVLGFFDAAEMQGFWTGLPCVKQDKDDLAAIIAPKEVTQEIVDLVEVADALLRDRLDRLMRKFAGKAPGSFGKYTNARINVDLGSRHEKPAVVPVTGTA